MSTFEEAFELTGQGKFNHVVLVTCGLVLLNVTVESLGTGYIITAVECELQLTTSEKGWINAAAFIGIVSSAIVWGSLSDVHGRRAVMVPAGFAAATTSLISSFSNGFWMLFIFRMLTGGLVSASSATVYAYLGEMHTLAHRPAAIAWGSTFISFTFIILPALAWAIIPGTWSLSVGFMVLRPWRVFMWCWWLPGLMATVSLLLLPESPRFLLAQRSPEQALPVLARMYAWNHGVKKEAFPVHTIVTGEVPIIHAGGVRILLSNLRHATRPPLLACVLISHICMFMIFMLSSGLYMWVPVIVNDVFINTNRTICICDIYATKFHNASKSQDVACKQPIDPTSYPMLMGMGSIFALTYLAIGLVINRFRRKLLYCNIVSICGAMLALVGLVPQPAVGVTLLVLGLCCGCAASILASVAVDVFPTSLRALALCTLYMVGRSGAAVGANLFGFGLQHLCKSTFVTLSALTVGSTLLMLLWPDPNKVRTVMERRGLTY